MNASQRRFSRRTLLKAAVAGGMAANGLTRLAIAGEGDQSSLPPVRQITHGPKHHWFAYYDKFEFDPTNRYVLGMEVDFEHRTPKADDRIRIGMVDLADNDRWIDLDSSAAWCWQQGCMLQWRPGSESEILWNDREDGQYVCRFLDVKTGAKRTIPHPVYAVSPDGQWAIATDFRRLADVRPGYGYNGITDPNRDVLAPTDTGIFRIDLNTGEQKLLLSLAEIARLPYPHAELSQHMHWFNHLLVNTDGSRFTFLHRFRRAGEPNHKTRMITANADGSDVRVLIDSGGVSHFIWRDPDHVLAFAQVEATGPWGFFLFEDRPKGAIEQLGKDVMTGDGHCTYSPDKRWVLCDTYPNKQWDHDLYLYDVAKQRRVNLGKFSEPAEYYRGSSELEWRVDTHPRFSRDGRSVVIDSPCSGQGRQLHLIDVSAIVS